MKILIATDGSEYSRTAIEQSARVFGSNDQIEIKIISVYEDVFPIAGEPFALSADYYREMEKESKADAEKFAAEAKKLIRDNFNGMEPETEVRQGPPGRKIVEAAQEWGADLIVVGSHGRGFWGRMMVGSTSDAVMHHAPCSVLVVRRQDGDS
ncbi:MAG: universal stress protein [Pyrinomonadaceae bacterium]